MNRRQGASATKRYATLCGAAFGSFMLLAGSARATYQASESASLRTSRLELTDDAGRVRALLQVFEGEPRLVFFDQVGQERLVLELLGGESATERPGELSHGGSLSFLYPDGEPCVDLWASYGSPHGTSAGLKVGPCIGLRSSAMGGLGGEIDLHGERGSRLKLLAGDELMGPAIWMFGGRGARKSRAHHGFLRLGINPGGGFDEPKADFELEVRDGEGLHSAPIGEVVGSGRLPTQLARVSGSLLLIGFVAGLLGGCLGALLCFKLRAAL